MRFSSGKTSVEVFASEEGPGSGGLAFYAKAALSRTLLTASRFLDREAERVAGANFAVECGTDPYRPPGPASLLASEWAVGIYLSCEGVWGVLVPPLSQPQAVVPPPHYEDLVHTDVSLVVPAITRIVKALVPAVPPYSRVSVAVAVSGHVSLDGSSVVSSPDLRDHTRNWRDVPLASLLTQSTGHRVALVHDTNALALQEQHYGDGRGLHDFFVLLVGDQGVGCAIISNGQLVKGASGAAGEIGHCRIPGSRKLCRCGRTGCLERSVSFQSLRADLDEELEPDFQPTYEVLEITSEESRRTLRFAAQMVGETIAYGLNVLNPSAAITHLPLALVGDGKGGPSEFVSTVLETVSARAMSQVNDDCTFTWHALNPEFLAVGAVTYDRVFGGHSSPALPRETRPRSADRPRRASSS